MEKRRLGFAMTGSFCTWARVIPVLENLTRRYDIYPIFSPIGYESNNRFGNAVDWIHKVEKICGKPVWHTIEEVGPYVLVQNYAMRPFCAGICPHGPVRPDYTNRA